MMEVPLAEVRDEIKASDPSRGVVAASNRLGMKRLNTVPDMIAFNIYPGWYAASPEGVLWYRGECSPDDGQMADLVGRLCATNGLRVLGIGEYGAGAVKGIRGDLFREPAGVFHSYSEDYQVGVHFVNYRAILHDHRVWGAFVWQLFDSGSDNKKESVRHGLNNKGLIAFDHKTPKDAFWFYKANWNPEPMLYLVGCDRKDQASRTVQVCGFCNVGEVTLTVNGRVVGRKAPDEVKTVLWLDVPLADGDNVVGLSCGGLSASATWRCTPEVKAIDASSATFTKLSFHGQNAVCVRRGSLSYTFSDASGRYALALTQDRRLLEEEVVCAGLEQKLIVRAYRLDAVACPDSLPQSPVSPGVCYFPQKIALVPVSGSQTNVTLFPWCETGYWCYKPYECEAWQLRQMRAEADKGVLHFNYPGVFMQLKDEPEAEFSPARIPGRECIVGFPGCPPHRIDRPSWPVSPVLGNGVYDAGRLGIGYVRVESERCPQMHVGESLAEAMSSDTNGFEQSTRMVDCGNGLWRSENPLALRYLRFDDTVRNVFFDTQVDWRDAAGSYTCDNPRYVSMWRLGRDTLRICNRTFFVDGIKRDRLPWAGDLVVAILSQAYTFGDPEPIKRHLAAIASTEPELGQVNGIISFSLWWVVGHDLLQRYFGDMDYLRLHYPRICARMRELESHEDERGFLVRNIGWDFMDWTDSSGENLRSEVSRQAIYYWGLRSAQRLAERMGDTTSAARWASHAERLKAVALAAGMDGTRQSRILSILSGLAEGDLVRRLAHELAMGDLPPTVTPYMSTYEVMALARNGEVEAAVRKFESVWGKMLDAGVDAYWEGGDSSQSGAERYVYYGRPFGKSLCHSWASGPAFLIPGVFLGIRPTSDGWRTYEAKPVASDFAKGAHVAVPAASGVVRVDFAR